VKLSRALAHALRHDLGTLPARSDGFVPVEALLARAEFKGVSAEDVAKVVSCCRWRRRHFH
jgi:RNA:NAD 2'-phosphotransferase (TPT1/KptA family)